jgi:hypothetical protein
LRLSVFAREKIVNVIKYTYLLRTAVSYKLSTNKTKR